MENIGKRVLITKGPSKDGYGTVVRMVGSGHSRKFVVKFDNDQENVFSAKAFQVEDEYDGSEDEGGEHAEPRAQDRGGNPPNPLPGPQGGDADQAEGLGGFDPDWIALVQELMYVFQRLYYFSEKF